MHSRILGRIRFDESRLARDLATLATSPFTQEYADFVVGKWQSLVLINGSGQAEDAHFRPYDGRLQSTEHARRLPYISELIASQFDTASLKWARIFFIHDGVLVSHRDFVEIEKPCVRINIALRTEPLCLHSEEDDVFRMRLGEVWYLEATRTHSACAFASAQRYSLCLDFETSPKDLDRLVRSSARTDTVSSPDLVSRQDLSKDELSALLGLGAVINVHNFKDVVALLARVQFYRRVHAESMFAWLEEICARSRDLELIAMAVRYRDFCIGKRSLYQRLDLRD